MRDIATQGIFVADSLFDNLPTSAVICHNSTGVLPISPEPEWVRWGLVAEGQRLWTNYFGTSFTALLMCLMSGFNIARFGEVLYHNGYAKDAETARVRYSATAFAVADWLRFPLDDVNGRSRQTINKVRAMHTFARRRSRRLFQPEEGVALSQYDMAEVLLAFSGICLQAMKEDFNTHISGAELEPMVHMWRLIGYHLGIQDRFNVCASVERMNSCLQEFNTFCEQRAATARPYTNKLRSMALEGFGTFTGIGSVLLGSMTFDLNYKTDVLQNKSLGERPKIRGLTRASSAGLKRASSVASLVLSSKIGGDVLKQVIYSASDIRNDDRPKFTRYQKSLVLLSEGLDYYVWSPPSSVPFLTMAGFCGIFVGTMLFRHVL
ncbi:hypothetical protein SARC_00160 [Sphaeroforma arctica JP610]|uniref:ER-bound oxygenase mpaB/mpaB'/Rubber oxygenase catalytic domain-containing protein n=1 Tax=Sphaeroforma arctica JP610 TaxID=667725 RepID=A0A0L0GFW9_9EUKA|nr:hypothetical protein SARC_00160 [Sphaeroforma arctica JP610]KNC87726.1 hypothetical protein SARC_00160 [Sphaeroforma arctica JP610]|eukprot:XP_014161628.1 hypothetical protein SARC_00160 [Sphaeroforma arctica JP610]